MSKKRIKNIGVIVMLSIVLAFPLCQKQFGFIPERRLNGHFEPMLFPTFSWEDWFAGSYQPKFSKWLEENIGLRTFFVNVHNQYRFSLFRQISASRTFVGKDKVLYQNSYLKSYMGQEFLGAAMIKENVHKIKLVQDELVKLGKPFLYVIAPGKAYFFPEYLPDTVDVSTRDTTNYDVYIRELKEQGVNHIDFLDYFLQAKDTCRHPIFPRGGTHWSGYAVLLAMDSIMKNLEQQSGIDLVDYRISTGYTTTDSLLHTDQDIEDGLNLLFGISDWDMYYPKLDIDTSRKFVRPTLLDVGDSFNKVFYGFYEELFQSAFHPQSRYWFYSRMVSWPGEKNVDDPPLDVSNIESELERFDMVLILSTEANLHYNGYNFIKNAYLKFTDEGQFIEEKRQERITAVLEKMRGDDKWMKNLKERAEAAGIPLEVRMRRDATWIIDRQDEKKSKQGS